MGLPDTTSRTVYKIREAEAPILSATITVMKKISFRSIFLRPSYCARPIWSPDFKPLCYRWNRPIFWATLTMETKRKPSRILIRKFGESHQKPCSGSVGAAGTSDEGDLTREHSLHTGGVTGSIPVAPTTHHV